MSQVIRQLEAAWTYRIDLYICHKLYERVRKARTSREGYAAMHALWPENSALPCSHCSLLLLNRCFVVWSTREEASKSISPLPSCPNSGSYSVCANQREKRFSEFRSWMVLALLKRSHDPSQHLRTIRQITGPGPPAARRSAGVVAWASSGSTNFTSLPSHPVPTFAAYMMTYGDGSKPWYPWWTSR